MSKQTAVQRAFAALGKKYGTTSLTGSKAQVTGVIPTGDEAIDRYVLGCGGLPQGRIIEVFGPESAGKSAFLASCIASTQRLGGVVALCDAEQAFEPGRARKVYGINPDEVLHLDPDHQQQGCQMMLDYVRSLPKAVEGGPPHLVALDSVPALPPKEELEGEMEDVVMGVRARLYSRFCSAIVKDLPKHNCTLVIVNQIRMKIGIVFGNPETTPGGNAIKFYSSVRLRFNAGKIKDGSLWGSVKAVKNKVSEPGRKAETRLNFKTGFDSDWSILTLAKELDLVEEGSRDVETARAAVDVFCRLDGLTQKELDGEPKPKKTKKAKAAGKEEGAAEMPFGTED